MKYSIVLVLCFSVLLFTSCKEVKVEDKASPDAIAVYRSDIDQVAGFIINPSIRRSELARSGKYVSVVNPECPYSFGLTNFLKNLTDKNIKSVRISAWVMIKNFNSDAKLVGELINEQGSIELWEGAPLKEFVRKPKEWTKVTVEVKLEKDGKSFYGPDKKLQIYLFSTGKEEVMMDDLMIELF